MALHPTGLGKGLDALIRETHDARESNGVQMLRLDDIVPNPRQPRRNFNEKALEELAASIRSQGLLQPLLVRPTGPATPNKYEIVAGERRWRASRIAGLAEVPVLVRSFSAQDTLAAALIENLQREDLNPIEEALGLQTLKEEFGLSQDELAQKLGKSRPAIANSLRLLSLPESMRPLIAEGRLSAGHARTLLSITDPRAQEYLKNLILESRLSVREAEGLASGWKETGKFTLSGVTTDELPLLETYSETEQAGELEESAEPGAEAGAEPAANRMEEKKTKPQSARILEIQNRIGDLFQIPVRVTGKETRGKISFSYNSKEELEQLLERLSAHALEGSQHAALPGRQQAGLEGRRQDALKHMDMSMLERAGFDVLTGNDLPELVGVSREALSSPERVSLPIVDRVSLAGTERASLAGPERRALRASVTAALAQHSAGSFGAAPQSVADSEQPKAAADDPAANAPDSGAEGEAIADVSLKTAAQVGDGQSPEAQAQTQGPQAQGPQAQETRAPETQTGGMSSLEVSQASPAARPGAVTTDEGQE